VAGASILEKGMNFESSTTFFEKNAYARNVVQPMFSVARNWRAEPGKKTAKGACMKRTIYDGGKSRMANLTMPPPSISQSKTAPVFSVLPFLAPFCASRKRDMQVQKCR
jgi:hypothetical protein